MSRPWRHLGFIAWVVSGFSIPGFAAEGKTLRCGWYSWPPYQYAQTRRDIEVVTGLDV